MQKIASIRLDMVNEVSTIPLLSVNRERRAGFGFGHNGCRTAALILIEADSAVARGSLRLASLEAAAYTLRSTLGRTGERMAHRANLAQRWSEQS
jgi:hypothetical protein